jgi:error-prone DNA polymerase
LADSALPLWAAADAGALPQAEVAEPGVSLTAMSEAREVVEDYRSVSLTLRRHPVEFLRPALKARGVTPCGDLASTRDGRWGRFAGLVLVRQKPGSAKGVMFITIEDETGIGNVVIWPSVFDANRPLIISARMLEVRGRIQREGLVVHIVAATVGDLSPMLASLGRREEGFPLPHGRGDEVKRGSAPDPREAKPGIKVPTRDFR